MDSQLPELPPAPAVILKAVRDELQRLILLRDECSQKIADAEEFLRTHTEAPAASAGAWGESIVSQPKYKAAQQAKNRRVSDLLDSVVAAAKEQK